MKSYNEMLKLSRETGMGVASKFQENQLINWQDVLIVKKYIVKIMDVRLKIRLLRRLK